MSILSIFLLLICFFKSIYYGIYEIQTKKNKPGGITVCVLAFLGLIFPTTVIIIVYLI